MRTRLLFVALFVLSSLWASPSSADTISTPVTHGDQLLFFYDTTGARVPFLVVSTLGEREEFVEIEWTTEDPGSVLFSQQISLQPGLPLILDPQQIPEVQGHLGLVVVTPVLNQFNPVAIVPSSPLYGGFTLADTAVGSGFGQNPFARNVVTSRGIPASPGTRVDGTDAFYQAIAPERLTVPFFFDPTSPGLTDRVLLVAFEDRYTEGRHDLGPLRLNVEVELSSGVGQSVGDFVNTVDSFLVASIDGWAQGLITSSGSGTLRPLMPLRPRENLMGLLSQSLGTFAVGQRLPGRRPVAGGQASTAEPVTIFEDQTSLSGSSEVQFQSPDRIGQTFTFGETGTLVRLDVALDALPAGPEPLILEMISAEGGAPSNDGDDIFFSAPLPIGALTSDGSGRFFARFDLTSFDLAGPRGSVLAFSLRRPGNGGLQISSIASGYGGGGSFVDEGSSWMPASGGDLIFRTYLRVP